MVGRAQGQKSIPDKGAQATVVPIQLLHFLAIDESSILPIAIAITAVNAAPVDVNGGVLVRI